jgi:hypothetical protein
MKPTGRFNPLGDEIMQIEVTDIRWDKKWEDLDLNEIADFCSLIKIPFYATSGEFKNDEAVKAKFISYQEFLAVEDDKNDLSTARTMAQVLNDNVLNRTKKGISPDIFDIIRNLVYGNRKDTIEAGDFFIHVETGMYGHMVISEVVKPKEGKEHIPYEEWGKQHQSEAEEVINRYTTLWTDFSTTDPYNRSAPVYIGVSFDELELLGQTEDYREFITKKKDDKYNREQLNDPHYRESSGLVIFGLCIAKENKDQFLERLRILIDKPAFSA